MKKYHAIIIIFCLFFNANFYSSPVLNWTKFEIKNNILEVNFHLSGAANQELISLIFSNKSINIKYKIDILQKKGILRKDNIVWGPLTITSIIKYDTFSRVITIDYDFHGEKKTKRIVNTNNFKQTIRLIIAYFFNKSWEVKIPLNNLNRKENTYYLRLIVSVESINLAPPYNIINSSFNFTIEENKDIE